MLAEGGSELCNNQADHPLHLAFGEMIVKTLQAGINSTSGHMWPPSCSLLTFGLEGQEQN